MSDRDSKAFEFYEDPAHREPAPGAPNRRPERALTQHVPVRFPATTIGRVRELAEADGMTVSSWIRRAVERDLQRSGGVPSGRGLSDAREMIEHLQRGLDELAATLERPRRPSRR